MRQSTDNFLALSWFFLFSGLLLKAAFCEHACPYRQFVLSALLETLSLCPAEHGAPHHFRVVLTMLPIRTG